MKQKMMMLAVLLVAAVMVKAQYTSVREFSGVNALKADKIKIDARASILLVSEDMQQHISVEGNEADVKDIIVSFNGKDLEIASKSGADYKGKLIVKIPVKSLSAIEVNGASEVVSLQALPSKNLDVIVSSDCKLRLKAAGNINVSAAEGYDFDYLYTNPRKLYVLVDEE